MLTLYSYTFLIKNNNIQYTIEQLAHSLTRASFLVRQSGTIGYNDNIKYISKKQVKL